MFKIVAIVAGLGLALSAAAEAQTPRKGGTIRMTAPYGSSFTSMDIHTTQRAQDEIYAKGLHRSLYIWDSAEGKPVLELAKEVTVSGGGLVHTFKLRDDAYFHHGRKMTADDIIWTYNRIMDGTKAYPGARYVRVIEGAADGREGPGQGNLRPEENRRLHARNEADRESRSGFLLLHRADFDLSRRRGRQGGLHPEADRSWAVQIRRARAGIARRPGAVGQVLQARQAVRRQAHRVAHGRSRGARCRLPQQGNRHLGARDRRSMSPIRPTPTSRAPSSKSPRSSPATWG